MARIRSVDSSGTIVLAFCGEPVALQPGGEARRQSVGPGDSPTCVVTTTYQVTNHGFQDRARIVYP